MENKIILELQDGTEMIENNIDFINLVGENNTVRIKAESVEKFKSIKGLLIAVFGSNNTINLDRIIYPVAIRVPTGEIASTGIKDTTDYSQLNKFQVVEKG